MSNKMTIIYKYYLLSIHTIPAPCPNTVLSAGCSLLNRLGENSALIKLAIVGKEADNKLLH